MRSREFTWNSFLNYETSRLKNSEFLNGIIRGPTGVNLKSFPARTERCARVGLNENTAKVQNSRKMSRTQPIFITEHVLARKTKCK